MEKLGTWRLGNLEGTFIEHMCNWFLIVSTMDNRPIGIITRLLSQEMQSKMVISNSVRDMLKSESWISHRDGIGIT